VIVSPGLSAASATVMRSRDWALDHRIQGRQHAVLDHSRIPSLAPTMIMGSFGRYSARTIRDHEVLLSGPWLG
jgi:hypothetical protein